MSGEGKVVCVTGASGYIASWLVKQLLQLGYTVKATSRSEIGKTWNLLPYEEKAKFQGSDVVQVAARNIQLSNLSIAIMTSPTTLTCLQWIKKSVAQQIIWAMKIKPSMYALSVVSDSEETIRRAETACAIDIHGRRFAINSSVFSRVLGISDQGDQICISGDVPNFDFWKSKFAITSRGIFLKDIEHSLEEMTTADDEFKVTLCLFLLGTILCPSAIDYVQTGYLIPLGDVGSIGTKNWSSWCFSALCEGIEKFQKNRQRLKTCCISGCVLFLELFYLHSLQWDSLMVDKSLIHVVCWTNVKIRKCVTRLHTEGGVGTNQISVDDFFKQPALAEGQYDAAAHGETSHANQQPGTVNNAHIKGMQVVKDIQATLKTELSDIQTKVNFLYAKYSSAKDKNSEKDLHNTNSHQKSKHHSPPNPSPNSPPPLPSRPLIIPTIQHPIVEVSSNNTRTLPQHQQNISKSTPSSINAPDLHMEDQRIDDLYHVPAVLTVPSLVDEMQSLDIVLADDIDVAFPTSFSFTAFSISYAEAPNQPNGYNCGLFVCMFMDDNCPTSVQMK
ncbi:hypothetical protein EZV62_017156 [Acer yangbiense]|uniref:NmrA-like domain-containing protein n=1 Tax=Acer yangbiense TaxID=1000413 RepID=A0A5C7HFD9_9ROSI|nr:hypothetical protein EZV62_017156 [Acer yangbiense]